MRQTYTVGAGAVTGLAGLALLGAGLAIASQRKKGRSGDDAPGFTARRDFGSYDVVGRTVTIARPRRELFAFWRDFQNLPHFMENVIEVRPTDGASRSVWKILGPANRVFDVETDVVREEEGELIAWRSVPGSDIETEGRVTFEDAPGNRGTRVGLIIAYKPPAGNVGRTVAKLLRREPEVQARHDVKRLKALLETGEITTSARRRDKTRAARMEEKV